MHTLAPSTWADTVVRLGLVSNELPYLEGQLAKAQAALEIADSVYLAQDCLCRAQDAAERILAQIRAIRMDL